MADPFAHHPELRDMIVDPRTSKNRNLDLGAIDARVAELGIEPGWRRPDDEREAMRRAAMQGREDRDLWVFAYASLMWDPGLIFEEVRMAHAPAHQRRFCLWDEIGRGTPDCPSLMAALDRGSGCTGVAFRIAAQRLEEETFVLFRRELITPAYVPEFLRVETALGTVEALSFLADHTADKVVTGLGREQQARMIASAVGVLGTGREYLANLVRHLEALGIEDPEMFELWEAVCALARR